MKTFIKKKRWLSILLIACMLLTSLPLSAFAEEYIDEGAEVLEDLSEGTNQGEQEPLTEESLRAEEIIDEVDEEDIEDLSQPQLQSKQEEVVLNESESGEEEKTEALPQLMGISLTEDELEDICIIAKTNDGKFYGIKTYWQYASNLSDNKSLYELSEDQYYSLSNQFFLELKREGDEAFELPKIKMSDGGEIPGEVFLSLKFKNHLSYRYLYNTHPAHENKYRGAMWQMNLYDDWVIEEDENGYGPHESDMTYTIGISHSCEINGNGHSIYKNVAGSASALIYIDKIENFSTPVVKFKNITIDGIDNTTNEKSYIGIMTTENYVPEEKKVEIHLTGGVTFRNCKNSTVYGSAINLRPVGAVLKSNTEEMNKENIFETCSNGSPIYLGDENVAEISNTLFRNNIIERGGALYTEDKSTITINNCKFLENEASYGGAICILNGNAEITVKNSEFEGNSAATGGAFYSMAKSNIDNTIFTGNVATSSGGAVYISKNSETVINNSEFIENNCARTGGGISASSSSNLQVNESTFSGNEAKWGAGIYTEKDAGLTVNGGEYDGNVASIYGGMLAVYSTKPVSLNDVNVLKNQASWGGGIYFKGADKLKIAGGKYDGNRANGLGGALYCPTGNLSIENAKFSENEALAGGAIHAAVPTEITGATFTKNKAHVDPEDDTTNPHDTGTGGALYIMDKKTVIKDSQFLENWAFGSGGAIEINGVTRNQGAPGKPITGIKEGLEVEISEGTVFKGNVVTVGQGGAIHTIPYQYVDPINLENPDAEWKKQAYQNLTIASDTIFEGNRSEAGFSNPPENWDKFDNLAFAKNSFTGIEVVDEILHKSLLNNYDVNYRNEPVEIIYVGNGGTIEVGGEQKDKKVIEYPIDLTDGGNLAVQITIIADVPTREGYTFMGWLGEDGKTYKAGDKLTVGGNKIFVAQWEKSSSGGEATYYTITYDANGGEIFSPNAVSGTTGQGVEIQSFTYPYGTMITIINAPIREGYKFLYWRGSEYYPGDSYKVVSDHTFTAVWEKELEVLEEEPEEPGKPDKPDKPNKPGTDPHPSVPIVPPGTDLKPSIPKIPQAGAGR